IAQPRERTLMSDVQSDSPAAAETEAASLPPASATNAADSAVTAPASDPYREAFERLRAGETPQQIQADLHGRSSGSESRPTPSTSPTSQPAGGTAEAEDYGLDEKELNALRRAKFD